MSDASGRSSKWLRRVLLALCIVVAAVMGWMAYLALRPSPVTAVEAELDRVDPGWRWADMQAELPAIPDDENAALVILAAASEVPRGWPGSRLNEGAMPDNEYTDVVSEVAALPVAKLPNSEQQKELEAAMEQARAALAKALTLGKYRRGHFPDQIDPANPLGGSRSHGSQARVVATVLQSELIRRLARNDADGAGECCRALLGVARAFGDDGTIINQLTRLAIRGEAARGIERLLAQSQLGEPALAALQRATEEERQGHSLVNALRWERAYQHELVLAMVANKAPGGKPPEVLDQVRDLFSQENLRHQTSKSVLRENHAEILAYTTALIEWLKHPSHETAERVNRYYEKALRTQKEEGIGSSLFLQVLTSWEKFVEAYQRNEAILVSAEVALASERYRIKHGNWPETLAKLVPEYLTAVPPDPFLPGEQLRSKRTSNGMVIYSVGPDLQDNGGNLIRIGRATRGTDVGVQVFDVEHRREQSPAKEPAGGK